MSKQKLSTKQIDRIAEQFQQNNSDGAAAKSKGEKSKSGFLWGALAGIGAAALAPLLATKMRPAIREVLKVGIATGRYLQKKAEGVQEDLQDLTAEARSELDGGNVATEG